MHSFWSSIFIITNTIKSFVTGLDMSYHFSSVQLLSHVWVFATPWIAICQASLSITNSRSPPKPMSIVSVMPSNHLILCHPILLLPSIFPSIRVFSNDSAVCIRWPKYWSFSFNISPSNEYSGLITLGWTGWISLQSSVMQTKKFQMSQLGLEKEEEPGIKLQHSLNWREN